MNTQKQDLISKTEAHVKALFNGEGSHDWWHILRVWNNAKHIAAGEQADQFIVEMAALLHDVGDAKLSADGQDHSRELITQWLDDLGLATEDKLHICDIVENMSFSKNITSKRELSLEGQIVQDADRLDAIGAIGIARCFAYGGHKGVELYNPDLAPAKLATMEQYRAGGNPSLNHFYEKLLLLKDMLNTKTAKQIAQGRHTFMEQYLEQFYGEWEGKR